MNSSVSTQESSRREKEIDKDGYAVYRFEFYEIRLPPSWKNGKCILTFLKSSIGNTW